MPEKNFTCSALNITIKRKLFAQNFKNKVNSKRYSKFDKDWRLLKSRSGCRTDKFFLEYLLRLAKKDLLQNRIDKEKKNVKNVLRNKNFFNKYEDYSQRWIKPVSSHLEKEKKIYNGGKEVHSKVSKIKNSRSIPVNAPNKVTTKEKGIHDMSLNTIKSIEDSNAKALALNRLDSGGTNKKLGISPSFCEVSCDKNIKYIELQNRTEPLATKKKLEFNKNEVIDSFKSSEKRPVKLKGKQDNRKAKKFENSIKVLQTKKPLMSPFLNSCHPDHQVRNVNSFENFDQKKIIRIEEANVESNTEAQVDNIVNMRTSKISETCLTEFSLPSFLILKTIDIKHGLGIFSKTFIKASTEFGPLLGEKVKEKDLRDDLDMKDIWEVQTENKVTYISTQNTKTSNWLKFLRPAESKESANLLTFVKNQSLYFESVMDIQVGEELLYWTHDQNSPWSKKKLEKKNCGGCNINFTHTLYYRKHCMIFHDPNISLTTRKYYCKICGLAVLGKEKIMKHAAEMHQGKGAYQCQYCLKFFLRLNYLEMHRTYGCAKNPHRSRPLCDLCGRKFCQPQKLKVHIKRMHSDMAVVLRDFQCKNCEKILGSRVALQRHLREVHNKDVVGAFTCDRCGKLFQNKSNLKIHMLTHSGVKPFKCQVTDCSAAFTTKQCLQIHYKKIHGFTDVDIPKIERSIAYTFDAYSGGSVSDPGKELFHQVETVSRTPKNNLKSPLLSSLSSETSNKKLYSTPPFSPENPEQKCEKFDYFKRYKLADEAKSQNFDKSDSVSKPHIQNTKLISRSNQQLWKTVSIEKADLNGKSNIQESSNTNLIMKVGIKDINEEPKSNNNNNSLSSEAILENNTEMNIDDQYETNPSDIGNSENIKSYFIEKDFESEIKTFYKEKKLFYSKDKNEVFNTSLRINSCPFSEVQKDLSIPGRENDNVSLTSIDIENSQDKVVHYGYKHKEEIRSEKIEFYKGSDFDSLPTNKSSERNSETQNEPRFLDRCKNLEIGLSRLKGEDYMKESYAETEEDEQVQNLCLKEKPYQCRSFDDLEKSERDSSGFENGLLGDVGRINIQNFSSPLFRGSHTIISPRSYPSSFEAESVDLSIRSSFPSSLPYNLDLTPGRVEFSARHLDLRNHLGLQSFRFESPTGAMISESTQMSPTNYGIYQYGSSGQRTCQGSQFQPYSSIYY